MSTEREVLRIRLLGRFEVLRDGEPVPDEDWGRRKTETLLKVLLTEPGRVFSQDRLLDLLFSGEDLERARSNLFGRMSQLRRALEPDLKRGVDSTFIRREGQGYYFDVSGPCWIDTVGFARLLEEGEKHLREGRNAEATEALEGAVGLYRGTFLEADPYEEWTLEAREGWQERYISALTGLAEAYAHAGDRHRAVMACRTAFDLRPSRELVLQQLMRYHHAAGERSEALRVYERGVEALKRDLDVEPSSETVALRERVMAEAAPEVEVARDRTRIAVLPLVNQSPDPEDEYFADGMTEELIYSLSKVRDLKVIAQTSSLAYKQTKKTVAEIGRELSIGSLIEGSVRKAGETLRITIQLIDVGSEEHLWAERYDREFRDVFAIQSEIAKEVAGALRVQLLDEAVEKLAAEPTKNLEAYTLYLKGRHLMKLDLYVFHVGIPDWEKAVGCFEAALNADPEFALAWSGLADALCLSWFWGNASDEFLARATAAADRAAALGPGLAEGYASQALVRWIRGSLGESERLFRKAIALAPRSAAPRRLYGKLLTQSDRKGEALVALLKAHEIDPLSAEANLDLANHYLFSGRHEEARIRTETVLDVAPRNTPARLMLAQSRMAGFDWAGAEEEYRTAINDEPAAPSPHLELAELLACLGRTEEARAELERGLELARSGAPSVSLEQAGIDYYALNEFSRALQLFEEEITAAPRARLAHWWAAVCHWRLGNDDDAFAGLERAEEANKGTGFHWVRSLYMTIYIYCIRGSLHARLGHRKEATEEIARIRACPEDLTDRSLTMAAVHLYLGETDEGLQCLRRSVDNHDICLRRTAFFGLPKDVVMDPRFAAIYERTGLPIEVVRRAG
ncbi:MAG: tetratricopeptide repeat protein [Candidatus Bipolaricaulota bacterium]|nr:MAG: tetratricopeptide repeat protein [Candidatus Bipolaricaulota bacterium]